MKITPGKLLNGKQFYHYQVQSFGNATQNELIVGLQRLNGIDYADYYMPNGEWFLKMGFLDALKYSMKYKALTGQIGADRTFGQCVQAYFLQMADGSAIGAGFGLACLWFGPECAVVIAGSCIIHS